MKTNETFKGEDYTAPVLHVIELTIDSKLLYNSNPGGNDPIGGNDL